MWSVIINGILVLTNMVIISKQENDTDTCFRPLLTRYGAVLITDHFTPLGLGQ